MIDGLKPYDRYKASGSEWVGPIPAHWEVRRAKYFFREVDERSTTGDEEMLSVSHKTGVTPRREKNVTMFLAESNVGQKRCAPGDIAVNTMWAWMAALGVVKQHGIVSPSYGTYRPHDATRFHTTYLDELLRTPAYRDEYVVRSTGITSSRLRLYPESFLRIPFPSPPREEQDLIVRFLRYANRRIRRYLLARRRLLELLAERREAATEEALKLGTRHLRIGIAAQQVRRPIDRLADEVYTPVGLYNRGRGIFHKTPTKGSDLGDSSFFWLRDGDLVLSGQFAWEGAVALAGAQDDGCVATHRYPVLRGAEGILETPFLLSFFKTGFGRLLLDLHSRGAAGRNRPLNVRTLLKEKIPIPPLDAQAPVCSLVQLEQRCQSAEAAVRVAVSEYRARLVTAVVTGQLDVRQAAARLEDVEGEAGDEADDLDEIDETNANEEDSEDPDEEADDGE